MVKRFAISLILAVCMLAGFGVARVSASTLDFYSGFETGTLDEWASTTGAASINTTESHTGDYSVQCNTSGSPAYVQQNNTGTRRVTWYMYIDTAPSANSTIFLDAVGGVPHALVLSTDRYILLVDNGSVTDIGTTQLALDTWYRISLHTSGACQVYINGNLEFGENMTWVPAIPAIGNHSSTTANLLFDDFACESLNEAGDMGDIRVLRAVPNAEGFHQEQSTGAYTDIDEVPGQAQGVEAEVYLAAVNDLISYTANFSDRSDLGLSASDNVQAVTSWFYYITDGGGANEYFTLVRDNSTDYATGIDDPKIDTWVSRLDATEPNSGTDWDWTSFDAFQAGMETNDRNKDMWINTVYMMVAYIAAPGACSPDISNTPDNYDFGQVVESANYTTGLGQFNVTNNSGGAVSITIQSTNMTGGTQWTISDTATPDEDIFGLKAGTSGDGDYVTVVKGNSPYNDLVSGLADSANTTWGLQLFTPTLFSDGTEKTCTVTITATCD